MLVAWQFLNRPRHGRNGALQSWGDHEMEVRENIASIDLPRGFDVAVGRGVVVEVRLVVVVIA